MFVNCSTKKIIMKKILVVIITISFISFSCTKNFEEMNTDPNRIDEIRPGTLLNPVLYELASFNTVRANDFTFGIMQVMIPFPSVTGGIHRYDVTENSGSSTWNTYYRWLANIKEMRRVSIVAEDPNYEAIAMTLNAWVYSQLTDCFGDVPMDEALLGDESVFRPAFNTQKDIYTRILAELDSANNKFVTSRPMIYGTEILYSNSVSKWKMFCNSLRLRLLLRVSKREEMDAFTKMAEILNNPSTYPVFTKNDEAAVLKITGITPNISPWGRAIDFTTSRAAGAFFIDSLNAMSDPRLDKWNTKAKDLAGNTITYKGIPAGYAGSESQFKYTPSNFNIALATAPMISVIMTYAEVEFIRAELILRGKLTGNAQTAYEKGVKAAIEQWGATVPANYFSNTNAAYNGKLERVLLQKYYALFFNDYQQWFEYRRTGLPVLPKNDGMLNNKIVPVRFPYPVTVRTGNYENYLQAVESMGGDNINTKVWWEK
jgi:hypothetical protein